MFFRKKIKENSKDVYSDSGKKRKRAEAFVDFEHWYISLEKQFGLRPNAQAFRDMIAKDYDIDTITFFADFSNPALRDEIQRLREVSSRLIDTQNPSPHYKKDFTDFIMLDSIYQRALSSKDLDTFILFTGDGHFGSVVSFLRTTLGKEVVIYGIKDATSNILKNSASSFVLLPSDEEIDLGIKRMIVEKVSSLHMHRRNARPTFMATAEAFAKEHEMPREKVVTLMNELIEEGELFQRRKFVGKGKVIKIICSRKSAPDDTK